MTLDPVWVVVRCRAGTCTRRFTVNARTAPQFSGKPYCRSCWDRGNRLRAQLGWTTYDTPPGTWPEEYDEPISTARSRS